MRVILDVHIYEPDIVHKILDCDRDQITDKYIDINQILRKYIGHKIVQNSIKSYITKYQYMCGCTYVELFLG